MNDKNYTLDPHDFVADVDFIENLKVGDLARDCFGRLAPVTKIFGRGVDIDGMAYVCYYTRFGSHNSEISNSIKEGRVIRTVGLTRQYSSAELDEVDRLA